LAPYKSSPLAAEDTAGMASDLIYLDYNATTRIDPRVLQKMMPFLEHEYGNAASRDHALGWRAAEAVEEARFNVAELINAKTTEITFTGSATESINMALKGLPAVRSTAKRGIITSPVEHEAVLGVCRQLMKCSAAAVDYLPVDACARVSPEHVARALDRRTDTVVAIMTANNEIGTINEIEQFAAISHRAGALFFTDATQAVGKIPVDVRVAEVDMLAFSSHKLYGPKGVGALFVRGGEPRIELEPLIVGGGHEKGLRAGTLNVSGIVGFGEACRLATIELPNEGARMEMLRDAFEARLREGVSGLRVNGAGARRLPNTASIVFPEVDARALLHDVWSVAASTKSACSSGDSRPSHVLSAIGLSPDDAYSSIRFSFGRFSAANSAEEAASRLAISVRKLRGARRTNHQERN
jgi:cysteine desulfurase